MTNTDILWYAFVYSLGLAIIVGIVSIVVWKLQRKSDRRLSGFTDQEIEDTIRKWISVPPFIVQKIPIDTKMFFFQFVINAGDNRPVSIARFKEQPNQIAIVSAGTLSPEQRTIYDSLPTNDKLSMLDELSGEMAKLGVSNNGIALPLARIDLTESISLDNLIGDVYLRERIQRIRRAIVLAQITISKHLRGKGNVKTQNNQT